MKNNYFCHLVNVKTYEFIGVECMDYTTVHEENNLDKNEWKFICSFDIR